MNSFRNSLLGIGDILFTLPAVKSLGGGHYYLTVQGSPYPVTDEHPLSDPIYKERIYSELVAFLEVQDYITGAEVANHTDLLPTTVNFSGFWYQHLPGELDPLRCWIEHWGGEIDLTEPWLSASPGSPFPGSNDPYVCVAFPPRYLNPAFDHSVLAECHYPIIYLGLQSEYEWFSGTYNVECPNIVADSISDMARIIGNAETFIGGVSCGSVLAEGLKTRRIFCATPRPVNWFTMYGSDSREVFSQIDYLSALREWEIIS